MPQKLLHKYIHQRGDSYHFRWRIPADLRLALGVTELTRSLHTRDRLTATVRAARFVEAIAGIKRVRRMYWMQEVDSDTYTLQLKKYWRDVLAMARKEKTIQTGLITVGDMVFDYGGDVDKELSAVLKAKEAGILPESVEPNLSKAGSGILFSELFEQFMTYKLDVVAARKEERKPLSDKMQKQYRHDVKILMEIWGDLPVTTITNKMLVNAILTIGELPKQNVKPYNRMTVPELLALEDIPDKDRVSSNKSDEARKMLQGIFKYALHEEIIAMSPARDLNLKLTSNRTFANYSKAEVVKMLTACAKEKEAWKRWLPLLASYTGARLGELVQLRKVDIKLDEDSRRHYILITDEAGSVKNKNATRQVPIHSALIEAGFLDFVETVNNRLFDNLKSESMTAWFVKFRDDLKIKKYNDFGERKVFHSFRHTFITLSLSAGNNPIHLQQVVGHERSKFGTTERYTHKFTMSVLFDVVDKVTYD